MSQFISVRNRTTGVEEARLDIPGELVGTRYAETIIRSYDGTPWVAEVMEDERHEADDQ